MSNGLVAQLGERCVRNAEVMGSIPTRSTSKAQLPCWAFIFLNLIHRGIAQLVARDIWDVEAGSSSLPTPTRDTDMVVYCDHIGNIFAEHT